MDELKALEIVRRVVCSAINTTEVDADESLIGSKSILDSPG